MKKMLALCFIVCGLWTAAFGENLTIDDAIVENMKNISGMLPPGAKVALFIESESKKMTDYIVGESNVFIMQSTKLSLVDKSKLSGILKKRGINEINEINESAALEIAKELGASSVIFGSISKAGKNYKFRVQAVDVAYGEVLGMHSLTVMEDEILADLAGSQSSQSSINSANNQNPNVQVVVVRDTPNSPAQSDATPTTLSDNYEKTNRLFLANRMQFALYDYYGDGYKVGMGYELEIGKYRELILTTTILSINYPPVVSGGGSKPSGNNNYYDGNSNPYDGNNYPYDYYDGDNYDNDGIGLNDDGIGIGGGAFIAAIISVSDYLKVIPGMDIGFWFHRAYGYNQLLFGGPDVRVMFGYQFIFLDVLAKVHLGPSIADSKFTGGGNNSERRFGAKFQWGVGVTLLLGGN